MSKSALTEKRRETVIGLLKSMNIKKSTVGGFDKDDVYECMQQLCDLYEQNIEELEDEYEAELNTLKAKYQKYDDNNDLYVSLIMEAKKSSNEIINQAKSEVETILAEGRDAIAKQEKELEQVRVGMDAEKNAIIAELNASREAVEAEKAAMKAEVEAEREKLSALKNKYRQQINSMEEEFADIKTNILRTSGKIDSLKSKLPAEDEEINWNVSNDVDAVDFPVEDIAVENILPTEEIVIEAIEGDVEVPANNDIVEEAVTLEDLVAPVDPIAELPEIEEISLDEFEIEDVVVEEAVEAPVEEPAVELTLEDLMAEIPEEAPAEEPVVEEFTLEDIEIDLSEFEVDAEATQEISFDGLEELFKEEK